MEPNPLRSLLNKLTSHTRHLHNRLRRRDIFTASDSSDSSVYKHALKFQRPTTVNYQDRPLNSASFIGKITYPPKKMKARNNFGIGVHTVIETLRSQNSPSLMILIKMWKEMAEVSLQQLKPNDLVYVRGPLESYIKPGPNGKPTSYYQVDVKEINYVARDDQGSNFAEPERIALTGDEKMEKYRNNLHLWQVFFYSPHEWWDCRKNKKSPKHPDFRHKDTGEALWINPADPPWIERQLRLIDSRMKEQGLQYYGTSSSELSLSPMVYDDLEEL